VRPSKSLVVRGGLVHTFRGLAGFLGVTFLCWGLYILKDAFANPLDAGAAGLINRAFILTLAVMLFSLIKPRKKPRTTNRNRAAESAAPAARSHLPPAAGAAGQDHSRDNLAFQCFYVDHSRIHP